MLPGREMTKPDGPEQKHKGFAGSFPGQTEGETMKPILTSMTALAVVLATFSGAEAGQMPNINIKPKPQVLKIRPPRIHVPMRLGTAARLMRKNDQAPKDDGGPQPEPPTAPVARTVQPKKQLVAIPPLPRERPYNEFVETDTGANIGPDTALPEKDTLLDENLVANLPGLWGNHVIDILEGFGEGALDGVFDKEPGGGDGFGLGRPGQIDGRPGDLAGYNPDDHVQPGGPYDPAAKDGVPRFFDDPFNPNGNGGSQGYSSPSEAVRDPRGLAGEFYATQRRNGEMKQIYSNRGPATRDVYGHRFVQGSGVVVVRDDGSGYHEMKGVDESGNRIRVRQDRDQDGNFSVHIEVRDPDGNLISLEHREINSEGERTGHTVWRAPDSQPGGEPSVQEQAAAQAWICNTTPWLCRPGSVGSTPFEMLTQPSEGGGTGSIMGSGDGPDLGQEAVTNTGDSNFNSEEGTGPGGGGGGGLDPTNPGDPEDPYDP
jgi:catechol 2,3-dioxygenase-like lactoylglutathione lyase family enzyme